MKKLFEESSHYIMNTIKVSVTGEHLPAGPQKIGVAATTSDIGRIKFEISDTVQ